MSDLKALQSRLYQLLSYWDHYQKLLPYMQESKQSEKMRYVISKIEKDLTTEKSQLLSEIERIAKAYTVNSVLLPTPDGYSELLMWHIPVIHGEDGETHCGLSFDESTLTDNERETQTLERVCNDCAIDYIRMFSDKDAS